MEKTVVLRVGSDKAGTVTLAQLVESYRVKLANAGVFAPLRNCVLLLDHFVRTLGLEHLDILEPEAQLKRNPLERTMLAGFLADRFWDELPTVFLTTEVLWGRLTRKQLETAPLRAETERLLEALRDFFRHRRVIILVHLRRADLYFESLYNQRVREGGSEDQAAYWDKLIAQDRPRNSLLLLDLLENCFGRPNIVIKPFERRQLAGGDLVFDTLQLLRIDPDTAGSFRRLLGNERLHRLLIETLPGLNARHGRMFSNPALLEISSHLNAIAGLPNQKLLLSAAKRREILDHFEPFYAEVSARYFGGRSLFLEPVDSPTETMALPPPAVEAVSRLLLDLAERERAGELTSERIQDTLSPLSALSWR